LWLLFYQILEVCSTELSRNFWQGLGLNVIMIANNNGNKSSEGSRHGGVNRGDKMLFHNQLSDRLTGELEADKRVNSYGETSKDRTIKNYLGVIRFLTEHGEHDCNPKLKNWLLLQEKLP
jgi:hypothetical protein